MPWLFLLPFSVMHTNALLSHKATVHHSNCRRWLTETVTCFRLYGLVKKNTFFFGFLQTSCSFPGHGHLFQTLHCQGKSWRRHKQPYISASCLKTFQNIKDEGDTSGQTKVICATLTVSQWIPLNWFAVQLHIFKKLEHVFQHTMFLYSNGGFYLYFHSFVLRSYSRYSRYREAEKREHLLIRHHKRKQLHIFCRPDQVSGKVLFCFNGPSRVRNEVSFVCYFLCLYWWLGAPKEQCIFVSTLSSYVICG